MQAIDLMGPIVKWRMLQWSFNACGGIEPINYSGRGGEFTCLCSLSKISLSAGDALCKQAIHKFANVYEIENKMGWLGCHRYVYRQLGWIVLESPDCLQCKTQTLVAKVWLRIALRQGTVRLSKNHVWGNHLRYVPFQKIGPHVHVTCWFEGKLSCIHLHQFNQFFHAIEFWCQNLLPVVILEPCSIWGVVWLHSFWNHDYVCLCM